MFMNWFKMFFKSKSTHVSSDAMSSVELGEYLFNMCLRHVSSFLDSLDHDPLKKLIRIDKGAINQVELLIAFMWSCFDLMQVEKYEKALTRMHSCFMNRMIKSGLQKEETWQVLQMRYDEYRQSHRSHNTIDFTFQKAAHDICKNILELDTQNTNLVLFTLVATTFKENALHIGKTIKNIPLKDC